MISQTQYHIIKPCKQKKNQTLKFDSNFYTYAVEGTLNELSGALEVPIILFESLSS